MKIKRFKLSEDVTKEHLIDCGFKDVSSLRSDGVCWYNVYPIRIKKLGFEASINIIFSENIKDWNDFDNVDVLDESFGQAYTPFYEALQSNNNRLFPVLKSVIKKYNEIMSNLPFLEEVN